MKNLWHVAELSFIICLIYHLNLSQETEKWLLGHDEIIKSQEKHLFKFFDFCGDKLNNLLAWMIDRVENLKGTFDSITEYSEKIVDLNNEFIINSKNIIIDKIKLHDEEIKKAKLDSLAKQLEKKEEKEKDLQKKYDKKDDKKEHKKFDSKTKLINLALQSVSKNKKHHHKGLYTEIPKKKHGRVKSQVFESKDIPIEEKEEKLDAPEVEINYESLKNLNLKDLLAKYPEYAKEFFSKDHIKSLKECIIIEIEKLMTSTYSGNMEKLKVICEINELCYSESNPKETLKNFSTFLFKKLSKAYDFNYYDSVEELDKEEVKKIFTADSPYKIIGEYILEKLLFLLELKSENAEVTLSLPPLTLSKSISSIDSGLSLERKSSKFDSKNLKKVSTSNKTMELVIKESGSVNPEELTLRSLIESYKVLKFFEKEDEVPATLNRFVTVKFIFNWIFNSPESNLVRDLLNKQHLRLKIREKGLQNIVKISNNKSYLLTTLLTNNNYGLLSFTLKSSLLNGVENVVKSFDVKNEDLEFVLMHYLEVFNTEIDSMKNYPKSELKNIKFISANMRVSEKSKIYDNFVHYRLQNLLLILSDVNILLSYFVSSPDISFKSKISESVLGKFIKASLEIIIINESIKDSIKLTRLTLDYTDNLRAVLGKLVLFSKNIENQFITDKIINGLFVSLETVISDLDNQEALLSNLLDIIYHVILYLQNVKYVSSSLYKDTSKLFSLILKSETPEIINKACKIAKLLKNVEGTDSSKAPGISGSSGSTGSISYSQDFFSQIFGKLGNLWIFKNKTGIPTKEEIKLNEVNNLSKVSKIPKFNVIIHMNAPEIEYQFLVNALYYWEEKYPSKLSLYKYTNDLTKPIEDKILLELFERNQLIIKDCDYDSKNIRYFNNLKSSNTKMHTLIKIVEERIGNLKKAIEEAQKSLTPPKTEKTGDNKEGTLKPSETQTAKEKEKDDAVKENIAKMKIQEAYQVRIMNHIVTAEKIGKSACTRGFVSIEPSMDKEKAELFAEYIHKAANRLFPRFNANLDDEVPLFTMDALYPRFPEEKDIINGCTNTLKELTKPFYNVTIISDDCYERLNTNINSYKDILSTYGDVKRIKTQNLNINCNDFPDKVINNSQTSGASISIIIEDILNLVYNTLDNPANLTKFEKKISETITSINKSTWKDLKTESKLEILGLLIVLSGSHKFLRAGSMALLNSNKDQVCRVVFGGNHTGINSAKVIFLKDKQAKIDEVKVENLDKINSNQKIIKYINVNELIASTVEAYEILLENREDVINKNLLHFNLKLLNDLFSEEHSHKESLYDK